MSEPILIILTSITTAFFSGVVIFALQKQMEKRLQQNLEDYRSELQKTRDQEIRHLEFIQRQLEEFYVPMIGCWQRIQTLGELRVEINKASEVAWMKLCERQPKPFLDSEKYHEPYQKTIEYQNQQSRDVIMPLYDEMKSVFTKKYWLAESSTKK